MSNNSGIKAQNINNLSRARSTPINVLQNFAAHSAARVMQGLLNTAYQLGLDDTAWREQESTVNATPLSADVITGLKIRPFSSYVLIAAGILAAHATSSSYNSLLDSDYALVQSPGVTSSTALTFVANGSGSPRLDVIECALTEETTTISEDIYDPSTGLFTATLQVDTRTVVLSFRIRQGVAGSGYPGHAAGWLPLCIALHPGITASFADVDFYDVRPLVSSRTSNPGRLSVGGKHGHQNHYFFSMSNTGGDLDGAFHCSSNVVNTGVRAGPYESRGRICPTVPGTTVESGHLTLGAAHCKPGVSASPPGATIEFRYLLAAEPHDLPRWARYTTAVTGTGEREPSDNWGLYFIANNTVAVDEDGKMTSFESLPTGYGLTSQYAAQLVAVWRQTGPSAGSNTFPFFTRGDGWVEFSDSDTNFASATPSSIVAATLFPFKCILGPRGQDYLPYACSGFKIRVTFSVTPTSAVNSSRLTARLTQLSTNLSATKESRMGPMNNGVAAQVSEVFDFTIPAENLRHPGNAPYDLNFAVDCELFLTGGGTVTATVSSISFVILGVTLGY